MKRQVLILVAGAALVSAACFEFTRRSDSGPTSTGAARIAGTWASTAPTPQSLQESCTNFRWEVTETVGNTARGTFSATCFGNMQIAGSAQGVLNGQIITWTATATGTVPGQPPCPISLSGTADLSGEQIVIPFSGTTCMGPISGTEILKRS